MTHALRARAVHWSMVAVEPVAPSAPNPAGPRIRATYATTKMRRSLSVLARTWRTTQATSQQAASLPSACLLAHQAPVTTTSQINDQIDPAYEMSACSGAVAMQDSASHAIPRGEDPRFLHVLDI